jgi:hypothetical protein
MCSTVLSKRRGIQPLSAHAACVEGYDVVFNMPGLYPIEPAFANLVVQESGVAYGVLYELSAHDFERLRSFEGKYYADVRLRVRTQAGWAIHAHAFQGRSKAPPRRPSQRYLALLIEGAKEHHLPPDYVKRLQQTPSIHIPVISALMYAAARPRGTLALAKEKAGLISY